MAELPRYRPLGLAIPSVPTVDFTMAGRARARAGDAVAKGLDAMGEYVYKRQVAQTQREALQYAFDNPVTADQIEQAVAEGRDVDEIVGDPDTVFGAITSATAATQLTTELETHLSSRLAEYNARIDGGDPSFNIREMRDDLASMISGHTDVISQVDVKSALKYNAAANTLAAATYKSGLEHSIKIDQALRKDRANAQLDLAPNIIKRIVMTHAGDVKTTIGTIGTALRVTNDAIIATGDASFIETSSEKIRSIVTEQFQNTLVDWAAQSSATTKRALNGDFGDKYTSLYGYLDDKEKAETREQIRKRRDARIADEKVDKDIGLRNAKIEVQRQTTNMADLARTSYRGAEYNKAIDELQALAILYPEAITQTAITSLDKALDPTKDTVSNYTGMFELKRRILGSEIQTADDLQKQAINLGVSPKDYYSIFPFLEKDTKAEASEVHRIILRNTKIVEGTTPSQDQSKAYFAFERDLTVRYEDRINEWERGGGVGIRPTRLSIAKEIDLELRRSDEQKELDAAVRNLARRFDPQNPTLVPLNITIDENTTIDVIEDALRAAGYTGNDYNDYVNRARSELATIKRAKDRRDALR